MNGVHDLGGTDGLGPVVPEEDEPVWHADWERAAFSMFFAGALQGYYNLDMFRSGIEQMHPAEYLSSSYYHHWIHTIENHVVAAGAFDRDEIDRRAEHFAAHPDAPMPEGEANPELATTFVSVARAGLPAGRESDATPKFAVGDRVTVTGDSPHGHTRKARYIRGRTGVVETVHKPFIYPDSASAGKGEDPQIVYSVGFTGAELWGDEAAEPRSSVVFDVWEPYITAAA